jgi:ketosteroid isomerase-like protein
VGHSETHRQLHRMFNERQFAAMEEHFAPQFIFEDLPRALTLKSAREFLEYLEHGWVGSFSDAQVEAGEYSEGPDSSVCVFHGRGVSDGPLGDLPPTGRSMDLVLTEVLQFDGDGKVVSGQLNYDQLTMLQQVGHLPAQGAPPQDAPADMVGKFFEAFDRLDFDTLLAHTAADAQGVDEISRRWLRGREDIAEYMRSLAGAVSDVSTSLSDLEERRYGDIAVVTCWIEQDYALEGVATHVSAPCTIVLHREDAAWKAALLSAVPLEQTTG